MKTNSIPKEAQYNTTILDSYSKAKSVLEKYEKVTVSVSGGKDSDVMLDIIYRLDAEHKVDYVFYDTGLEYDATKRHLNDLEKKYGIEIHRVKAFKTVPYCAKHIGQPFISKIVSGVVETFQKHNFDWKDEDFQTLLGKYSKASSSVRWWCNEYHLKNGEGAERWNISAIKFLKEFMIQNPPQFNVSAKCCKYAKKKTAAEYEKGRELCVMGIRQAEGGVRSIKYKNCFSERKDNISQYRPLFWYRDNDVKEYSKIFEIRHSDCYEVWRLKRTGCVGCPLAGNLIHELEIIEQYEPKLARACKAVFKESYEYTLKFRRFAEDMKYKGQLLLVNDNPCDSCL